MKILANGFLMAYSDTLIGSPLLFIHGFPLNRHMWAPQITALTGDARIIAPDLRGHGESPPLNGPYDMDLLATDLHSLLDALGIQGRVVICGHSMGGYVAFAYYRKYPDRIRGMILTASRAAPDTPEGKAGRDALTQKVRVVGIEPIVSGMASKLLSPSNVVQKPELVTQIKDIMLKTSPEGMVGALMGMRDRPDSTPTLGLIQVPTLVIHGADDQIVPLDEARAVAAALREARLEVIPGAGHLPNLERPEKYNHVVSSFLNDFAIK